MKVKRTVAKPLTPATHATPASIAMVERDTGLSKDTLRVWERRYGFPQPLRDSHGERVYPTEQLEKLRVIRRLMDSGQRPGQVVAESLPALNARIRAIRAIRVNLALPEGNLGNDDDIPVVTEALRLLKTHLYDELRRMLTHALVQRGLQRFVLEVVTPLNERVGNAWIEGRLQIFDEHLYSELIQQLLRQATGSLTHSEQGPRILLTTLPGEQHKLGLLMAEACLAVEGAQCISLGVETPTLDIAQAARAHRVDIVGLSFSTAMQVNTARSGLTDLRKRLDRKIALWAGGSLMQHMQHMQKRRKPLPEVTILSSLSAISDVLQQWHKEHG